ncbi:MAG: ATP-binding cassette domain-containing protein [Bacteroidales bacterium]|jgi:cell division transport system ATP-binding protein|nr:ATP-binding cassette domain-containing protein [Bacteroidales bacterium]
MEEFNTPKPIISLKNIDIYQKKLMILNNITITINKGEVVYLIGKTGTGKSSILKLLIADEKAHGEHAEIVGYDLKTIKNKQIPFLRRKLGVIFQDYQLLSEKTVFENLGNALKAIGCKEKDERYERVMKALDMVGLGTKHFKYPHQLSGGEQQRVCIARSLLNDPELLIADEPTGNLDPITSEEIFQIFHHINQKGTTVLIATHDFLMIDKFPSRSLLIEDGKIIDSGL